MMLCRVLETCALGSIETYCCFCPMMENSFLIEWFWFSILLWLLHSTSFLSLSLSLSLSLVDGLYTGCVLDGFPTHTLYLSIYLYLYRHFFGGQVVYEKPLKDVFTVKLYMMLA
ncbi:hypothetical protein J1N35_030124 [Gossypium stocksii]|uniref:Uncharacterized protein n=1 Tax=Gossypium stocksii TaxID=47602 RepID=A0A9D3ZTV2_9ROSI|nr:hypothetical protein J1N35_030124 [Gossypium stocksii]